MSRKETCRVQIQSKRHVARSMPSAAALMVFCCNDFRTIPSRYHTFFCGLNASVAHYRVEGLRCLQCRMAFEVRPVKCHVDRPATAWPAAEDASAFRSKDSIRQGRSVPNVLIRKPVQSCPMRWLKRRKVLRGRISVLLGHGEFRISQRFRPGGLKY